MTIRAKFYVTQKETSASAPGKITPQGKVVLGPVYSNEPNSENKAFWDATPSGRIEMWITNTAAYEALELGKTYYIDFIEAPDVPPA